MMFVFPFVENWLSIMRIYTMILELQVVIQTNISQTTLAILNVAILEWPNYTVRSWRIPDCSAVKKPK